jgi:hypothetical protein
MTTFVQYKLAQWLCQSLICTGGMFEPQITQKYKNTLSVSSPGSNGVKPGCPHGERPHPYKGCAVVVYGVYAVYIADLYQFNANIWRLNIYKFYHFYNLV